MVALKRQKLSSVVGLMPFQGERGDAWFTQGVALGYGLTGLSGRSRTSVPSHLRTFAPTYLRTSSLRD